MLLKLTYYGKDSTTLVGTEQIETVYRLYDKTRDKYSTKITFASGTYINVEEDLSHILKVQNEFVLDGNPQETTCVVPMIEDVQPVDQQFERSYNRRPYRQRSQPTW